MITSVEIPSKNHINLNNARPTRNLSKKRKTKIRISKFRFRCSTKLSFSGHETSAGAGEEAQKGTGTNANREKRALTRPQTTPEGIQRNEESPMCVLL